MQRLWNNEQFRLRNKKREKKNFHRLFAKLNVHANFRATKMDDLELGTIDVWLKVA